MPADNVTLTSSNFMQSFKQLLNAASTAPPRAGDISPANRGVRAMPAAARMANILFAGSVPVWQQYLALLSIPLVMTAIVGWDPCSVCGICEWRAAPRSCSMPVAGPAAPDHNPGVVEPLWPQQTSRQPDDHPSRRAA